jgi:hypothetical protein
MKLSVDCQKTDQRCRNCESVFAAVEGTIFQDESPAGQFILGFHGNSEQSATGHLAISLFNLNDFQAAPQAVAMLLGHYGPELAEWEQSPWEQLTLTSFGRLLSRAEAAASSILEAVLNMAHHITSQDSVTSIVAGETDFGICTESNSDFDSSNLVHEKPLAYVDAEAIINLAYAGMPGCFETLHAVRLDEKRYRIQSIPFFAQHISLGDIVAIDADGNYLGTLEKSKQITMRIAIDPSCDCTESLHERLHALLDRESLLHEWHRTDYGAASIPDKEKLDKLKGLLSSLWETIPSFYFEADEER